MRLHSAAFAAACHRLITALGVPAFVKISSRHSVICRLASDDFVPLLAKLLWLLGGDVDRFTAFLGNCVAAHLGDAGFFERLQKLLTLLGSDLDLLTSVMSDAMAARLGKAVFWDKLPALVDALGVRRFVSLVGHNGIAARLHLLNKDFFAFVISTGPGWTTTLSTALCKVVDYRQTTPVAAAVWEGVLAQRAPLQRRSRRQGAPPAP